MSESHERDGARPTTRQERMPVETRERLLTTAAREFAAHGYEHASLNRILAEAHVGKSSAYYYFEDKADLFCATVRYCLDQLRLALEPVELAALTAETYWDVFAQTHDRPLELTREQPWLFGAVRAAEQLSAASLRQPRLAELAAAIQQFMNGGMRALLARGQELGVVRTDVPADLLLGWFQAIDGASDAWILPRTRHLDAETLAHLSRQTVAAIRGVLSPRAPDGAR